DQLKPHRGKPACDWLQRRLVLVADADKGATVGGEIGRGRQFRLGESHRERAIDSHHLSRRLHLRTENRVHAGETDEGENRLLDRYVNRRALGGKAELAELASRHYKRCELRSEEH